MSIYLANYLNGLPVGGDEWGEVTSALRGTVDPKHGGKTPQLRQVTNRVGIPSLYSAGTTGQMSRSWQISYVPIRKIKVGWANWGVDINNVKGLGAGTEVGPGAPMTLQLSVEYPMGTFTRLTFDNGATSGTISDGATGESDLVDLGFTIPPFRKFRIAAYAACASGTWNMNYQNGCDRARGDEFAFNGANNIMNTTVAGSNNASGMRPLYVLAQSDLGVWGMVGGSILTPLGEEDGFLDPSGGVGILGRAVARLSPALNYGVPGDLAQYFVASHDRRLAAFLRAGVTRMINQHGNNDFATGRTAAQLLADKASIRSYIPAVPWFECTSMPRTSGTWATAAGQSVWNAAQNAQRLTLNNTVRAGIAGVEGILDLASIVETSSANEVGPVKDGGVWLGGLTADGVHPNVRAVLLALPLVEGLLAAHGS